MKQELTWMIVVIVGVLIALLCSRVVRTMVRESVIHPKQTCKIAVTNEKVTVIPQQKTVAEEAKHGRS